MISQTDTGAAGAIPDDCRVHPLPLAIKLPDGCIEFTVRLLPPEAALLDRLAKFMPWLNPAIIFEAAAVESIQYIFDPMQDGFDTEMCNALVDHSTDRAMYTRLHERALDHDYTGKPKRRKRK